METLEDSEKNLLEEVLLFFALESYLFKECGADFKRNLFHSDCLLKQVNRDLLDVCNLLIRVVGELANDSHQECAHCRNQELHLFAPISDVFKH